MVLIAWFIWLDKSNAMFVKADKLVVWQRDGGLSFLVKLQVAPNG